MAFEPEAPRAGFGWFAEPLPRAVADVLVAEAAVFARSSRCDASYALFSIADIIS